MKVAVIGAGVMGMSCAWRLARAGVAVEVFDSRAAGGGASGAALGALWPASPLVNGALQELHRESLWAFEGFLREVEGASGVKVGFERVGRVELLNSEKAVTRAREEAAVACATWPAFGGEGGLPTMAVMSPGELRNVYPEIEAQTFSALVCRATAQVRVGELMAALAEACVRAGVTMRREAVLELVPHGKRIAALRTASSEVAVERVLVTAGAWSGTLGVEGEAVARVEPVKGQGIALRRPRAGAGFGLRTIVKRGPIYLIPWEEELLVGATTEEAGFDEGLTGEAREMLRAGVAAFIPALAGVEVVRHWAGLRPRSVGKPHLPVMGRHGAFGNLFVCTGHFKTGIGMAPRVSELMAEVVMNDNTGSFI